MKITKYWKILFYLPSPYKKRMMRICMYSIYIQRPGASGAVVRHEIWGTLTFWVMVGTLTWGNPLTFSHSFVFNRLLCYIPCTFRKMLLVWVVVRCRGHFTGFLSREPGVVLHNVASRSRIQWHWFPESRWSPKSCRISGCEQLIDTGREPRLSLMHPTAIDQGSDHHEYVRTSTICLQLANIRDLQELNSGPP